MIIETPSRLHVTLIDLNGEHGRVDGSVGITLNEPKLILEIEENNTVNEIIFKDSPYASNETLNSYNDKINRVIFKINKFLGVDTPYKVIMHEYYPSHSGLGSGTQLSLAIAKCLLELHGTELNTYEIARLVGRGGTSGIGVASFEMGGFIIDGGHKRVFKPDFLPSSASQALPPPIIARYDFPEDWNIVLVMPDMDGKISGDREVNIFQEYCPIPLSEVQELTYILIMEMMPALVERDLDAFGDAIDSIQNVGFKKIESDLQNNFTCELMDNLRLAGASGVGLSSFGPTVYAVTDTNTNSIIRAAENSLMGEGVVIVSKPRNHGATIIK